MLYNDQGDRVERSTNLLPSYAIPEMLQKPMWGKCDCPGGMQHNSASSTFERCHVIEPGCQMA